MIWDAGALSIYRYNSPIYRYLSNNPPPSNKWPRSWYEELGVFLATPGVSWRWCQYNFNMHGQRLNWVFNGTKHLHEERVWENIKSVTHDDALMYVRNKPPRSSNIPFWAVPFILDDLKAKIINRAEIGRKWQISQYAIQSMTKGVIGDVFHSGKKRGLRGHVGK